MASDPLSRPRIHPVAVAAGLLLGVALYRLLAAWTADFRPAQAAIRQYEHVPPARWNGRRIMFFDFHPLAETIRAFRSEGRRVFLIVGASQLHTIVDHPATAGEPQRYAVAWANDAAEERGADITYLQISHPNMNAVEMLGIYLYLRAHDALPDGSILAFVYDDLREPGVRKQIRDLLEPQREALRASDDPGAAMLLHALEEGDKPAAAVERHSLAGSPAEATERVLIDGLEAIWPAYVLRHNLRGAISFYGRKTLRLKATVRPSAGRAFSRPPPLPPVTEAWNRAGWTSLLDHAARDTVPTLVYAAPHPHFEHDSAYPSPASVDETVAWLRQAAATRGMGFVDLRTLVERTHFLDSNNAFDLFHFQSGGHLRLGRAIDKALRDSGALFPGTGEESPPSASSTAEDAPHAF